VSSAAEVAEETVDGLKKRLEGSGHKRSGSNVMIDD